MFALALWPAGAPAAAAISMFGTAGSSSQSIAISSMASSASARVAATTATTASPCQQASSRASGCCGGAAVARKWRELRLPWLADRGEVVAGHHRDHARTIASPPRSRCGGCAHANAGCAETRRGRRWPRRCHRCSGPCPRRSARPLAAACCARSSRVLSFMACRPRGGPRPLRSHRRSPDSRCNGSSCRTAPRGSRPGSACRARAVRPP